MQKTKQTLHRLWNVVRQHPWRSLLIGTCSIIVIFGIIAMIPRTIHFSYAGESCVSRLTVFPRTLTSTSATHEVAVKNVVSVGGVELFGRSVCVTPLTVPESGTQSARLSVGGIAFPALYFRIVTPEAPSVGLDVIKKPIAAARPLSLKLSTLDTTFDYILSTANRSVDCQASGGGVECDIAALQLAQGEAQHLKLERQFDGKEVATLFNDTVEVLPAVTVTESSVIDGQTVYTKNDPFVITTDKPLLSATAHLERQDNEEKVKHDVTVSVDGPRIEIIPTEEELPRAAVYTLVLDEVEAKDGSGLAGPHQISFTLSGGPKVASMNVGATSIDPGARIVLALDQTRKADQAITDIVKVQGVPATVTATNNSIIVSLAGAGRCTDFTITLSKEIISEHGIKATEDWTFKGRTRCYVVETVGYSVGGRPINAYIYGNGATTYLYTAGIHGNELSSVYTIQSWMNDLEANPGKIPAAARVVVIPSINPDGVAKASRVNNNGVNLNRNFPTHNWTGDIITSQGEQAGAGGSSAGSERETKALINATYRYVPRFVITYHSSGSLVNSNDVGVSIAGGQAYARLARYAFVPNSATTGTFGFEMTGTYEDWLLERGIAAILIELNTDRGNHFTQNRNAMWAMLGY